MTNRQPRKIKKIDRNWYCRRDTARTLRFKKRWIKFFICK